MAAATFNGATSLISYSATIPVTSEVSTIDLRMRTRRDSSNILHIRGVGAYVQNYITLGLFSGQLWLKFNLGREETFNLTEPATMDLANGQWNTISLTFKPTEVTLDIIASSSGSEMFAFPAAISVEIANVLQGASEIFLGGVDATYLARNAGMFSVPAYFKGCLDDVRIGGVLLPFFAKSQLRGNPATEQFYAEIIRDVQVNCIKDPVCVGNLCEHGSECVDVWNAYECNCTTGFNGSFCENNIDDCVNNDCENGAICEDGINNFTCQCLPGYTDTR